MLGATAAGLATAPLVVPALALSDVVRGRHQLPRLRTYLFALQYGVNDSVEILLAPLYWAAAGFGTRLDSRSSLDRHRRLQWWSLDLLSRRAERLLGLSIEIDDRSRAALRPGPVVVIGRHVSLFDASLPAVVYGRDGVATRGVVMAELLADPGFDLIYGRLGSVFVPRHDAPAARAAVEAMAASIRHHDGDDVAVGIYPEGRLFRPDVRDRLLGRLATSDPDRADRLAGLTHLLPPRSGGLRILLDALPAADVVVLDHRGLDDLGRLIDLADRAPLRRSVRITARRIPRHEIPEAGSATDRDPDGDAFSAWLDRLWLDLDRSVAADRADETADDGGPDPDGATPIRGRWGGPGS